MAHKTPDTVNCADTDHHDNTDNCTNTKKRLKVKLMSIIIPILVLALVLILILMRILVLIMVLDTDADTNMVMYSLAWSMLLWVYSLVWNMIKGYYSWVSSSAHRLYFLGLCYSMRSIGSLGYNIMQVFVFSSL